MLAGMKPKHKRLIAVLFMLASIFLGAYILLSNFRDNLIYFYPPKDIEAMRSTDATKFEHLLKRSIRVGGMVKENSYHKSGELDHDFIITDFTDDLAIKYHGLLPPMFREGQGVVAQGALSQENGKVVFTAAQLITKHDEKYMPPEIKRSLAKPEDKKVQ
jgi:cytochrome c-type biogenesis protein CcmE